MAAAPDEAPAAADTAVAAWLATACPAPALEAGLLGPCNAPAAAAEPAPVREPPDAEDALEAMDRRTDGPALCNAAAVEAAGCWCAVVVLVPDVGGRRPSADAETAAVPELAGASVAACAAAAAAAADDDDDDVASKLRVIGLDSGCAGGTTAGGAVTLCDGAAAGCGCACACACTFECGRDTPGHDCGLIASIDAAECPCPPPCPCPCPLLLLPRLKPCPYPYPGLMLPLVSVAV